MRTKQAGQMWLAAMGIVLVIAGSFFAWRLWLSYQKTSASHSWLVVPCRIESSRIISGRPTPSSAPVHRVEVRYQFEIDGVKHVSTRIRHVEAAPTAHREDALALQQKFPPGAESKCYVNPADHAESVLVPGTRAALYSIWFPLLFVVGGLGIIRGILRRKQVS